MKSKIKVFIVDDSAVVRQVLTELFNRDPGLEVVGGAPDPIFAYRKMQACWPDVIVLDVEMPRMDGISFLKKIMSERPTPTIICSTLTEKGTQTSLDALSAGAVEIVTKPKLGLKGFLHSASLDIINAVKTAANANVDRLKIDKPKGVKSENPENLLPTSVQQRAMSKTTEKIVAIGTSTGGTIALEQVLSSLPRVCPGIVIVQHMPEKFTSAFSERLNSVCRIQVKEAQQGDRVLPGLALIAQGGKHMRLMRSGAQYVVEVIDGPVVNRHKPSVDVLFRSVAHIAGKNAIGIIMTGMGDDGAKGLLEMRKIGAHTIAQDEKSCVVYGMPKEAVLLGAVDTIVSLNDIYKMIC